MWICGRHPIVFIKTTFKTRSYCSTAWSILYPDLEFLRASKSIVILGSCEFVLLVAQVTEGGPKSESFSHVYVCTSLYWVTCPGAATYIQLYAPMCGCTCQHTFYELDDRWFSSAGISTSQLIWDARGYMKRADTQVFYMILRQYSVIDYNLPRIGSQYCETQPWVQISVHLYCHAGPTIPCVD